MATATVDGGDEVEPKLGEVGEFFPAKGVVDKVGQHQSEATQTTRSTADAAKLGHIDAVSIAQNDLLDATAAVEQHTDLTPECKGEVDQVSGEDLRHNLHRGNRPLGESGKGAGLCWLEIRCIAEGRTHWGASCSSRSFRAMARACWALTPATLRA